MIGVFRVSLNNAHPNCFENSKYEKFDFKSKYKNQILNLKIEYDRAFLNTESKKVNVIIHGFDKKPSSIILNQKRIKKSKYKFENNLIIISFDCELDLTHEIEIKR